MPEQQKGAPDFERRTDEDFALMYANNVSYEASVWDLKLIFGQLDQKIIEGPGQAPAVEYHTAITLPWNAVKLLVYYLRANLAAHEIENGPIKLPQRVLPPEPPSPSEEDLAQNPLAEDLAKSSKRIWDEEFR